MSRTVPSPRPTQPSGLFERLATTLLWSVTIGVSALLLAGLGAIVWLGLPQLTPSFLFGAPTEIGAGGGIGPQLYNTALLAVIATLITAPLGIATGIWLERLAPPTRGVAALRFLVDTMAALPSIVVGMFGFVVFVVALGWGFSRLGAALTLAVVNLPFVVRATQAALERVPPALEEAAFSLGATRWQTLRDVTLPTAAPSLASTLVLAVGRVFAESAPLIFTAGVGSSSSTLAVHVWYVQSESLVPDAAAVAAGASLVLVLAVSVLQLLADRLSRPEGRP